MIPFAGVIRGEHHSSGWGWLGMGMPHWGDVNPYSLFGGCESVFLIGRAASPYGGGDAVLGLLFTAGTANGDQ